MTTEVTDLRPAPTPGAEPLTGTRTRLKLSYLGNSQELLFEGENELTVGRSKENDIQVPDPKVSRSHARLNMSAGDCTLADCDSGNGTWLNGRRIQVERLCVGDEIRLGGSSITILELSGTPASPPKTAPEAHSGGSEPHSRARSTRVSLLQRLKSRRGRPGALRSEAPDTSVSRPSRMAK